jgi:Ion channel
MPHQVHQVAIVTPLIVGAGAVLCTILIHALALGVTVNLFRRELRLGRAGMRYLIDLTIVVLVVSFTFVAHVIEVAVWALLFMICGEFQEFGAAFYHSAVNYSTLGYGDVIMSPSWKLLGPLEASNGSLMFGVSTAIIFSVILRLIQTRFADLRD